MTSSQTINHIGKDTSSEYGHTQCMGAPVFLGRPPFAPLQAPVQGPTKLRSMLGGWKESAKRVRWQEPLPASTRHHGLCAWWGGKESPWPGEPGSEDTSGSRVTTNGAPALGEASRQLPKPQSTSRWCFCAPHGLRLPAPRNSQASDLPGTSEYEVAQPKG